MGRASRLRLALTAVLLASLFYGSTCAVSTSSCNEFDCFEGCGCSGGCDCFGSCGFCLHVSESADSADDPRLPAWNEDGLRLESYALMVEIGADGSVWRSYRTILGPSFAPERSDQAEGSDQAPKRSNPTSDQRSGLIRFSAGILRANADLFGGARKPWNASIERVGHVTRVSFERETAHHDVSIAFLFDGDGRLVEILEYRAPRERG